MLAEGMVLTNQAHSGAENCSAEIGWLDET